MSEVNALGSGVVRVAILTILPASVLVTEKSATVFTLLRPFVNGALPVETSLAVPMLGDRHASRHS